MENRADERIPKIVEDRLQEAYGKIRRGEVEQRKRKLFTYRRCTGVAAVFAAVMVLSAGVLAAAAYFQKEIRQEGNQVTYEFHINYELVPGEYEVTPGYLPEGYADRGGGKYDRGDGLGITVMPIYTTAELDRAGAEISIKQIDHVEHTTLGGLEADIITFEEAEKYQCPTYVFLFNEVEGYVVQLIGQYPVEREELLKFADQLKIERIGDGAYETEEERSAREREEAMEAEADEQGARTWQELTELGIPQEKIYDVGEELTILDGAFGYMVTDYAYLDSMKGFEEADFFDFSRFDGWLNEDGTLKPYTRIRYDENWQPLEEELTEQEFLRVDMKVRCYKDQIFEEVPLDLALEYVEPQGDGVTWASDKYGSVPEEHYSLQLDHSSVYLNMAIHTEGENRKDYFFRSMEPGEELSYTLLFVVDKDREGAFLLSPLGGNFSLAQTSAETAEQILEELDGYIRLE